MVDRLFWQMGGCGGLSGKGLDFKIRPFCPRKSAYKRFVRAYFQQKDRTYIKLAWSDPGSPPAPDITFRF
jgi:hypothetical protein